MAQSPVVARPARTEASAEADEGHPNRRWILAAAGLGSAMSAVDSSVSNIVLPAIAGTFRADVTIAEWVVTSYLLVLSALLLSFGRLGDLRGHRNTYLAGYGLFIGSSAVCAFAPTLQVLIGARVVQAVGGAMLAANSPAILTMAFPERQRGQVLGLQATLTYLGLAIGPSLGGWLATSFWWGAVFLINVPLGALGFLLSQRFVPRDHAAPAAERRPFDLVGAALFTVGLVLFLLGLDRGNDWGWRSPALLGCLAIALLLLAAFIRRELATPSPMLDLRLFKERVFSGAIASALFNYMATYSLIFLLPFYLVQGRGFSEATAGLVMTAQPLVMAVMAPFSGRLSDRVGSRAPTTLGMLLLALALAGLSRLGANTPLQVVVGLLMLVGISVGLFTAPNNSAAFGAAPRAQRGSVSGVVATARNMGMVMGVGIAGAVFATLLGPATPGSVAANLVPAVDGGLLVAAILAACGALTSAVRSASARQVPLEAALNH